MLGYNACRFSASSLPRKIVSLIALLIPALCSAAGLVIGVHWFREVFPGGEPAGLSILKAILLFVWILFSFLVFRSVFVTCWGFVCFQDEGLSVHVPLQKNRVIPWPCFQTICVCYQNPIPGGPLGKSVICFIAHGEKPNIYGRWNVGSPLHFRRIIAVEYTHAIYEELTGRGLNVADLRETWNYRQ